MKSNNEIINVLNRKILILDGAVGTMIQNEELIEKKGRYYALYRQQGDN